MINKICLFLILIPLMATAYHEKASDVYETSIHGIRILVADYGDSLRTITYLDGPKVTKQVLFYQYNRCASSKDSEWFEGGFLHRYTTFNVYSSYDDQYILSK